MSEFAPTGNGARMTKSQVKKYIKDLEKKRELARKKLEEAKASGEFDKDKAELKLLEKALDNI